MKQTARGGGATLTAVLALTILAGCKNRVIVETHRMEEAIPPAETMSGGAPSPAGPTAAQARLGGRVAIGGEAAGAEHPDFAKWYRAQGSPRIAVILNRPLAGADSDFESVRREVVEGAGAGTASEGSKQSSAVGRVRLTRDIEHRVSAWRILSEGEALTVEQAFVEPFQRAGAVIVASDAVSRILRADSEVKPVTKRDAEDSEMKALGKAADWVIEVLTAEEPGGGGSLMLRARVIDLKQGRQIYSATSGQSGRALAIPGSEPVAARSPGRSLEAAASALASEVIRGLPGAAR